MGDYEFVVIPFGLTNALFTFQSLMNVVLAPYLQRIATVFFDEILIYSVSPTEHIQHLSTVFGTLIINKLFAKLKKYSFSHDQVEYLGHIMSTKGVARDPVKIQAHYIMSWIVLGTQV